jgi:hypothetical protein
MMQVAVVLPTWAQCSEKLDSGSAMTELEKFIYANEPAGNADCEWREHLADVLAEAINEDRLAHGDRFW